MHHPCIYHKKEGIKSDNCVYFTRISKKILIIKLGAAGDVIRTTPILRKLRKIYPDAKIDYLTTKWSKEAITLNPNIDEIIAVDDDVFFSKNPTKIIKLVKELKKRNYDRIYAFHRSKKIHLLCKLIGNKVTGISDGDFNPFLDEKIVLKRENSNYVADDYLKMFNIEIENSSLEFYWSKEDEIFIDNFPVSDFSLAWKSGQKENGEN